MKGRIMDKKDIGSFNYEELKEEIVKMGEKPFRSRQIYEWLHVKLADDFGEMTNLPKPLRLQLAERYEVACAQVVRKRVSKDGTVKYLFRMNDGELVESVLMRYHHGISICISIHVTTHISSCISIHIAICISAHVSIHTAVHTMVHVAIHSLLLFLLCFTLLVYATILPLLKIFHIFP